MNKTLFYIMGIYAIAVTLYVFNLNSKYLALELSSINKPQVVEKKANVIEADLNNDGIEDSISVQEEKDGLPLIVLLTSDKLMKEGMQKDASVNQYVIGLYNTFEQVQ